jgi:hypothetical protein
LADRLRECLEVFHAGVTVPKALIEEAAAELDRREALVTAVETYVRAYIAATPVANTPYEDRTSEEYQLMVAEEEAHDALLALILPETKEP